jgi:hypothetical protein
MAQLRRVLRPVIVYAPRAPTHRWINEELAGETCKVVAMPSLDALVSRLSERADQIAIVDFDAIDHAGVAALSAIRDSAWKGELIAIGRVEWPVRSLLRVHEVLVRPLGSERLRQLITNLAATTSVAFPRATSESTAETLPFR